MQVKFKKIKWDTGTDHNGKKLSAKACNLPTHCTLNVDKDCEVEYEGADVLSNKFGFCVFSFEYEIIGAIPSH